MCKINHQSISNRNRFKDNFLLTKWWKINPQSYFEIIEKIKKGLKEKKLMVIFCYLPNLHITNFHHRPFSSTVNSFSKQWWTLTYLKYFIFKHQNVIPYCSLWSASSIESFPVKTTPELFEQCIHKLHLQIQNIGCFYSKFKFISQMNCSISLEYYLALL